MRGARLTVAVIGLTLCSATAANAAPGPDGLLFRASADTPGDQGLAADTAAGDPRPNFASGVTVVLDGATGPAFRWADDGYATWNAPGNIYAQRGTLAFFWRPRTPVGLAPFVLFRVGFADHSSWDMAFLRIDWNGHGFDGFVTDANLARVRVSWTMPQTPAPDAWRHIAFGWDETRGVVLWVDGKEVARKVEKADLDSGLDQFGLAGRIIAPHQVQSRYHFMRGSDVDEIRVYDHLMGDAEVAALAAKQEPTPAEQSAADRAAWLHRYGWDRADPPALDAPVTTIRKVEFADAKDLKSWMWKGVDGIPETTWPGVYNRSRLPGRDDYFELPDWNVYVEGGKRYDLTVPEGVRFNRVELRGAAWGALGWTAPGGGDQGLAKRPQGVVRSLDQFAPLTGGRCISPTRRRNSRSRNCGPTMSALDPSRRAASSWPIASTPRLPPNSSHCPNSTPSSPAVTRRPNAPPLLRDRPPPDRQRWVRAIPPRSARPAAPRTSPRWSTCSSHRAFPTARPDARWRAPTIMAGKTCATGSTAWRSTCPSSIWRPMPRA